VSSKSAIESVYFASWRNLKMDDPSGTICCVALHSSSSRSKVKQANSDRNFQYRRSSTNDVGILSTAR